MSIGEDVLKRKDRAKVMPDMLDKLEPKESENAEEKRLESGVDRRKFPRELKAGSIPGELPPEPDQMGQVNVAVNVGSKRRKHSTE
jgi:hypothetical protein